MDEMEVENFRVETRWSDELEQAFLMKRRKSYERCIKRTPPTPNRVTFLQEQRCPSCGILSIYCCRIDSGENVEFVHICVNPQCGFIELKTVADEDFSDAETHPDYCPICEESREVKGAIPYYLRYY